LCQGIKGIIISPLLRSLQLFQCLDGNGTPLDLLNIGHDLLLIVPVEQVGDPGYETTGGQKSHIRECVGYLEFENEVLPRIWQQGGIGTHSSDGHQGSMGLSLVKGLHGCKLHGLLIGNDPCRGIASGYGGNGCDESEYCCNKGAPFSKQHLFVSKQKPGADPYYEKGSKQETGGDRVKELINCHIGEYHIPEVSHLIPCHFWIEDSSHRMLHPGIGHQDPDGRKTGSKGS